MISEAGRPHTCIRILQGKRAEGFSTAEALTMNRRPTRLKRTDTLAEALLQIAAQELQSILRVRHVFRSLQAETPRFRRAFSRAPVVDGRGQREEAAGDIVRHHDPLLHGPAILDVLPELLVGEQP